MRIRKPQSVKWRCQKRGNILRRKSCRRKKNGWILWLTEYLLSERTCGDVRRFHRSGSVFMPYGGKYQLTETQAMVAKVPVLKGKTDTVTMMSYGFDPYLSSWSPYHGAVYAVIESIARIVAAGGDYSKIRFTFQEYFRQNDRRSETLEPAFCSLAWCLCGTDGIRTSVYRRKRTVCPEPSMILMFRRHWFPLR